MSPSYSVIICRNHEHTLQDFKSSDKSARGPWVKRRETLNSSRLPSRPCKCCRVVLWCYSAACLWKAIRSDECLWRRPWPRCWCKWLLAACRRRGGFGIFCRSSGFIFTRQVRRSWSPMLCAGEKGGLKKGKSGLLRCHVLRVEQGFVSHSFSFNGLVHMLCFLVQSILLCKSPSPIHTRILTALLYTTSHSFTVGTQPSEEI